MSPPIIFGNLFHSFRVPKMFYGAYCFCRGVVLYEIVGLSPGGNLAAAFGTDNTIIYLEPGEYTGDFEVTAEGVLIFVVGPPTEGSLSTIKGNLSIKGGNARMRAVNVSETITVNANGFSAAFCKFNNASITGNSGAD